MSEGKKPVLYKCPYCVSGRFTEDDGWDGAIRHIRERHTESSRQKSRRGRRPRARDPLLEEEDACYPELMFAPA